MGAIPSANETVRDQGLGLVGNASLVPVVIGEASLGDDNSVKAFASVGKLVDERGQGPGVEAAALILALIGGPVIFVKCATAVAASNGSVTQSGAGPEVTLTGTALLDANLRVVVTLGGALGTGKFKYCLDDFSGATDSERTYSEELIIPSGGTFAIPTLGITLTFASGTYVLAETYSATVNCAAANATNVGAAMDALAASTLGWRFVYLATSNNAGDATAHATLLATLQSKLTTLATTGRYRRGIIATNMTGADPTTAFTSVVAARCLVGHGRARAITPKSFIGYASPVYPAAHFFALRAAGCLPSTDLKRVRGDGINDGGPLPNVLQIFDDEAKTPTGLDDIKVSTLRTWEGRDGFYVTQGRLKSAAGSDFTIWPRGICMDIACETAHAITVTWIGMGIRTNADGTIDERDAVRLENEVNAALANVLLNPQNAEGVPGHVSAARYTVNRLINIIETETIDGEVAIRPLGSVSYVTTVLSFSYSVGGEEAA
jgi:hypothetical protein